MKKTIAFMTLALVMAVALVGTGCKSRDVKGLALGLGPVPAAAPAPIACQGVAESYSLSGTGCWGYYTDITTSENEGGPFTDCGMDEWDTNLPQKVYEVTIDHADWLYIYASSGDEIGLSLRRNCNPGGNEADIIDCDVNYDYECSVSAYLSAGTYYFVIDNLCCVENSYSYEICVGGT